MVPFLVQELFNRLWLGNNIKKNKRGNINVSTISNSDMLEPSSDSEEEKEEINTSLV